jgi:hypothetical protein
VARATPSLTVPLVYDTRGGTGGGGTPITIAATLQFSGNTLFQGATLAKDVYNGPATLNNPTNTQRVLQITNAGKIEVL